MRGLSTKRRVGHGSGVFPRLAAVASAARPAADPATAVPAAPPDGPARGARGARLWRPVVAGVAVVGLVIGALVTHAALRADEARVRAALDRETSARAREFERETAALVEGVHALRTFLETAPGDGATAMHAWAREAAARHPAFRGIAWATTDGTRLVVTQATPRAAVLAAGDDVLADASRAAAVAASLESGVAALSEPATLPGRTHAGAWIVLALPAPDARPGAPRVARGALALEVSFDDLLRRIGTGSTGPDLVLSLVDDEAGRVIGGEAGEGGLRTEQPATALGRAFTLRADADPAAFAGQRGPSPYLLGALVMLLWELGNAALVGLARSWRTHALDRQAQVVHRAFEGLGEAVVLTDRTGRVVLANDAAAHLLGPEVRNGEARARALDPALGVTPATAPGADPVARALRGETVEPEERRLALAGAKDGAWVESAVRPLTDAAGGIEGALVVLRDVTARREAQETARRMHERDVEMAMAQRVQRHLYPGRCPAVPGLDLAGAVVPAAATCGDYYDVLVRPDGSVLVAVGDVSGHGLGPALVMAEVRTIVRAMVDAGLGPVEVLRHVDAVLAREHDGELFVTLLLVVVAPWTRRLTYANAGHVPGLVVDARGAVTARMAATGPPLGLGEGRLYHAKDAGTLETGDVLTIVTDGATESPGPEDEPFDEGGVVEVVRRRLDASAEEIVTELRSAIHTYSNGRCSRDDVTLVVAKATAP